MNLVNNKRQPKDCARKVKKNFTKRRLFPRQRTRTSKGITDLLLPQIHSCEGTTD